MIKSYAGIGSRETPEDMCQLFRRVALYLANNNYTLRSGHADGADLAFEHGCDMACGKKEIYLPWSNFNGSKSNLIVKDKKAFDIAQQFHPNWHRLSKGGQKLQARNSHQVLGWNLDDPVEFVICWTKNGSGSGGSGQAIRIAKSYNIPVFDAGKYKDADEARLQLWSFLKPLMNIK